MRNLNTICVENKRKMPKNIIKNNRLYHAVIFKRPFTRSVYGLLNPHGFTLITKIQLNSSKSMKYYAIKAADINKIHKRSVKSLRSTAWLFVKKV